VALCGHEQWYSHSKSKGIPSVLYLDDAQRQTRGGIPYTSHRGVLGSSMVWTIRTVTIHQWQPFWVQTRLGNLHYSKTICSLIQDLVKGQQHFRTRRKVGTYTHYWMTTNAMLYLNAYITFTMKRKMKSSTLFHSEPDAILYFFSSFRLRMFLSVFVTFLWCNIWHNYDGIN
jgi:hypothetical protein